MGQMDKLIDYIREMVDIESISDRIEHAPDNYKRMIIDKVIDECASDWLEEQLRTGRDFNEVCSIVQDENDMAKVHLIMEINKNLSAPIDIHNGEYLH